MVAKKVKNICEKINPGTRNKKIVRLLAKFEAVVLGRGKYKRAFKVKLNKRYYVVKFGKSVPREYGWYQVARKKARGDIAKIYWTTDYCCIQRCAERMASITDEGFLEFRKRVRKTAKDIRPANCGYFDGRLKCFDIGVLI